jgi:hypothetical protein
MPFKVKLEASSVMALAEDKWEASGSGAEAVAGTSSHLSAEQTTIGSAAYHASPPV